MEIVKIKTGYDNDDFIQNWETLRVTFKDGKEGYVKRDIDTRNLYYFNHNPINNETELTLVEPEIEKLINDWETKNRPN